MVQSESKSGHGHTSVPVEPEALTLPTHLEVGFSRLPPSRKGPGWKESRAAPRRIPLSRHSLLCGQHLEFPNSLIIGFLFSGEF